MSTVLIIVGAVIVAIILFIIVFNISRLLIRASFGKVKEQNSNKENGE